MKRLAILVGSWTEDDEKEFQQGIKADIQHFFSFLRSGIGGAWRQGVDLICLFNPTRKGLEDTIKQLEGCELGIVYFSGHGHHEFDYDMLNINSKDVFPVEYLFGNAKRQFVITDSCRNLYANFVGQISGLGELSFDCSNLEYARAVYNECILKSPYGRVLIQSSSKGQSSYATPSGGDFSKRLGRIFVEFQAKTKSYLLTASSLLKPGMFSLAFGQVPEVSYNSNEALKIPLAVNWQALVLRRQIEEEESRRKANKEVVGLVLSVSILAIAVAVFAGRK